MRIIEQRSLRGPNLYAATPCLLAVAATAPADRAEHVAGIRLARFEEDHLQVEPDVHQAIRAVLARCEKGDVLLFGCGSDISGLLEAVRPTSPEVAKRIAMEAA